MSAGFAAVFGESIRMTRYVPAVIHPLADIERLHARAFLPIREVVRTTAAQPFLISGSGTLGWDQESPHVTIFLHRQAHAHTNLGFGQPRGARRKRSGTQHGIFR